MTGLGDTNPAVMPARLSIGVFWNERSSNVDGRDKPANAINCARKDALSIGDALD